MINSVRNMVCGITKHTTGVVIPGVAVRSAGIVIYVAVRSVTLVVRGVMVSSVAVWSREHLPVVLRSCCI